MNAFDDLVPTASGPFDDLVPQRPVAGNVQPLNNTLKQRGQDIVNETVRLGQSFKQGAQVLGEVPGRVVTEVGNIPSYIDHTISATKKIASSPRYLGGTEGNVLEAVSKVLRMSKEQLVDVTGRGLTFGPKSLTKAGTPGSPDFQLPLIEREVIPAHKETIYGDETQTQPIGLSPFGSGGLRLPGNAIGQRDVPEQVSTPTTLGGVYNATAKFLNSMLSREGLPKTVGTLNPIGIAAQAPEFAFSAPQAYRENVEKLRTGTSGERGEAAANIIARTVGMVGAGSYLRGKEPAPTGARPEYDPTVRRSYGVFKGADVELGREVTGLEGAPKFAPEVTEAVLQGRRSSMQDVPIVGRPNVRQAPRYGDIQARTGEAPKIESQGGKVSFAAQAEQGSIPSARQSKEGPSTASEQERLMQSQFVPATEKGRVQMGMDPDVIKRLRPAVKIAGRLMVGKMGESHDDILDRFGYDKHTFSHETPERGFELDGEFLDRMKAQQRSGLVGTSSGVPGLDSQDLPGGERHIIQRYLTAFKDAGLDTLYSEHGIKPEGEETTPYVVFDNPTPEQNAKIKAAAQKVDAHFEERKGRTGVYFNEGRPKAVLQDWQDFSEHLTGKEVPKLGERGRLTMGIDPEFFKHNPDNYDVSKVSWPHGMWLSSKGEIEDASPGHYESGAKKLGEKEQKGPEGIDEGHLDHVLSTMRQKGYVELRGRRDGIEVIYGKLSRTQKAALERWGIQHEKKVWDSNGEVIYEPPSKRPGEGGKLTMGVDPSELFRKTGKEKLSPENILQHMTRLSSLKEVDKRLETVTNREKALDLEMRYADFSPELQRRRVAHDNERNDLLDQKAKLLSQGREATLQQRQGNIGPYTDKYTGEKFSMGLDLSKWLDPSPRGGFKEKVKKAAIVVPFGDDKMKRLTELGLKPEDFKGYQAGSMYKGLSKFLKDKNLRPLLWDSYAADREIVSSALRKFGGYEDDPRLDPERVRAGVERKQRAESFEPEPMKLKTRDEILSSETPFDKTPSEIGSKLSELSEAEFTGKYRQVYKAYKALSEREEYDKDAGKGNLQAFNKVQNAWAKTSEVFEAEAKRRKISLAEHREYAEGSGGGLKERRLPLEEAMSELGVMPFKGKQLRQHITQISDKEVIDRYSDAYKVYRKFEEQEHPDKANPMRTPGAFERIRSAWDIVSTRFEKEAKDRGIDLDKVRGKATGKLYMGLPVTDALRALTGDARALYHQLSKSGRKLSEDVMSKWQAAQNKPLKAGEFAASDLQLELNKDFAKDSKIADQAALAALSSKDLNSLEIKIAGKNKDAEAAVAFARKNETKVRAFVDKARALDDANVAFALSEGVKVESLSKHLEKYIESADPGHLMEKRRTKPAPEGLNSFDAVTREEVPKTLSLKAVMQERTAEIQHKLEVKQYFDHFKGQNVPQTKEPIIRSIGKGGVPPGYDALPGYNIAVHKGYGALFEVATGESALRRNLVGKAALETQGFLKHFGFAFDFFHLATESINRWSYSPLSFKAEYRKGLGVLEYSESGLKEAVKQGIEPESSLVYATEKTKFANGLNKTLTNRQIAERGASAGLMIGKHSEALYTAFIRSAPIIRQTMGASNKFIFDKVTRGAIQEAYNIEVKRLAKAQPNVDLAVIERKVAKDINFNFGNIGKEGLIKSNLMQDASLLVWSAPRWFESQIQTEGRAAGQIARTVAGRVIPGVPRQPLGSLGRSRKNIGIAMLVGVEALNYALNGKFTWDNEDKNHKVDAFIPPLTEGGKGFYISALTRTADMLHDMKRYTDGGMTSVEAMKRITANRFSGPMRELVDETTGKDYRGQPIENHFTHALGNLSPVPLPFKAAARSADEGSTVPIERQGFSMLGMKSEPESTQEQTSREVAGYKTIVGKNVPPQTLVDRAANTAFTKEQRGPVSRAQDVAMRTRAVEVEAKRGQDLEDSLEKRDQQWLKSRGLKLPGVKATITYGKQNLRLTGPELDHYKDILKTAIEVEMDQLREKYDRKDPTEATRFYHERMAEAHKIARELLLKEMKQSSSAIEQDRKKKFSIYDPQR